MADHEVVVDRSKSPAATGLIITSVVALVASLGSMVWCYGLQNHLAVAEQQLQSSEQKNVALADKLDQTNARLRATSETLGNSVGMTQKQLEARATSILSAQKVETARLERQQAATSKQLGAVSTDVASVKDDVGGVKTDVGGVKTDVATTKQDLEQTKAQLQRTIGDAGVMSGLIATNHDELEILKHKGDRNYYEFTLRKGQAPVLLQDVKLQLKKINDKHSKYTMNVSADDRNIEKKDKSLDEPVQFYSGKTPALYEIVVNSMEKNQVSGYLSTPKNVQTASAK